MVTTLGCYSDNMSVQKPRTIFYPRKNKMSEAAAKSCNEVFVSCDTMKQGGGAVSQKFASFETHQDFLDFVALSADACFYEMIRDSRPCKMYFDVEWITQPSSHEAGAITIDDIENVICRVFACMFPEAPQGLQCVRLKGSRMVSKGLKNSFHLIYPGVVFSRNNGAMKNVARRAAEALRKKTGLSAIDTAVYTKDRAFRAPFCYKLADDTKTPFLFENGGATQDAPWDHTDILQALITHIPPQSEYAHYYIHDPYSSPAPPHALCPAPPKPVRVFPLSRPMPSNISKLVACLSLFLERKGGKGVVSQCNSLRQTQNGISFRYNHRIPGIAEPCLSHGPFSTVHHKTDHQFVHIDNTSFVVVVCPHGAKCVKSFFSFGRLMKKCTPVMEILGVNP